MKHMKVWIILLISIVILIVCYMLIFNNPEIRNQINKTIFQKQNMEEEILSYEVKDDTDLQNIEVLISIKDAKGIDSIEYPDGFLLSCKGKDTVSIDYKAKEKQKYTFKIRKNGGEEKEESICVIKSPVVSDKNAYATITSTGIKCDKVSLTIEQDSQVKTYYSYNQADWIEYTGEAFEPKGVTIYVQNKNEVIQAKSAIKSFKVFAEDAINYDAFDEDENTFYLAGWQTYKYINIDQSAWGKTLNLKSCGYQGISFLNENGNAVYSTPYFRDAVSSHIIPSNTARLRYYFNENGGIYHMVISD